MIKIFLQQKHLIGEYLICWSVKYHNGESLTRINVCTTKIPRGKF